MENTPVRTVIGEITDFLANNPSPQEIVAYRLPDDLQARAHELLDLNSADKLTSDEREEMMDYVRVERMMNLLKAKTKLKRASKKDE